MADSISTSLDQNLSPTQEVAEQSIAQKHPGFEQPLLKVTGLTGKTEIDGSGQSSFTWLKPVMANPMDENCQPIPPTKVGSLQIYDLPEEILDADSSQFVEIYLSPRTVEGLYDYVSPTEAGKMAAVFGVDLKDVPEPPVVMSASAERKVDRRSVRDNATAARRLTTAMSGGPGAATAALALQTGAGSMEAGNPAAKAARELLERAKQG